MPSSAPPPDEPLAAAITAVASAAAGRLRFELTTSSALGKDLGIPLSRTGNRVYDFKVSPAGQDPFRCIAYTLALDSKARNASRAEALGRGLAAKDGELFKYNPFLLVYDTSGRQFMAVSAVLLFGAFKNALENAPRSRAVTATFSLTPNFSKGTISLYGLVAGAQIWRSSINASQLTLDALEQGLIKIRDETSTRAKEIPGLVNAIQKRLTSTENTGTALSVGSGPAMIPMRDTAAEEDVKISARLWRMILRAVQSSPAVLLVGPPGTGKTALIRKVVKEVTANPAFFGLSTPFAGALWATPDESWSARELVGGDTVVDGAIRFRPGWLLRSVAENRWLILDEANRADMDRIFGGVLTWLSGGTVALGAASTDANAPLVELGWNTRTSDCVTEGLENGELVGESGTVRYLAGRGWRLLGTYNALDAQRVFRFGAALGRRFVRVPIPATEPESFANILVGQTPDLSTEARTAVVNLYRAHYDSDATRLGPALFLAMCRYLAVAAQDSAELGEFDEVPEALDDDQGQLGEEQDAPSEPLTAAGQESLKHVLTEAYIIHMGAWLAHLEKDDYTALGNRVRTSGIVDESDWQWMTAMIQALA